MGWHLLKRLLQAIPLLLGIVTVTFFMMQLAPGDPMDIYLEPERQGQVDPEVIELLRQKYGLDIRLLLLPVGSKGRLTSL